MQHRDHLNLLRGAIPEAGGAWADLGSGHGAFTLALAELVGPQGLIYSVDTDGHALREQAQAMRSRYPAHTVSYLTADFTQPLNLPPLDGIVMANALHFVEARRKLRVVELVKSYLRPGGRLVVVEYNVDTGNTWVPFPFTFPRWEALARQAGFEHTQLLATAPSHFLTGFYSAMSW
jgi:ubiquinone/menaquinone biosynthesis C-methylase UbiE